MPSLVRQAAAIPFRVRDGTVEFCLITTTRERRWSIPKGKIDPGETPIETALRETWEEAGLRGHIDGPSLGRYEYAKGGRALTVDVYLMRVTEAADTWQEQRARDRRWVAAPDGAELLTGHPVRELFRDAVARLAEAR
jgi:8-oxo-dGTP pyrophosphatase MutT (NUDIX family)